MPNNVFCAHLFLPDLLPRDIWSTPCQVDATRWLLTYFLLNKWFLQKPARLHNLVLELIMLLVLCSFFDSHHLRIWQLNFSPIICILWPQLRLIFSWASVTLLLLFLYSIFSSSFSNEPEYVIYSPDFWVLWIECSFFWRKEKKTQEVLCMPCTSFKIHLQLEIMLSRLLICQHFRLRRPTQSKTWFYMCGFLYLNSCQCCSLHTEFKCRFWSTDRLFLLCDDSVSELNNLIHFNTLLVPIDNVSTCVTSRAHLWWRGS